MANAGSSDSAATESPGADPSETTPIMNYVEAVPPASPLPTPPCTVLERGVLPLHRARDISAVNFVVFILMFLVAWLLNMDVFSGILGGSNVPAVPSDLRFTSWKCGLRTQIVNTGGTASKQSSAILSAVAKIMRSNSDVGVQELFTNSDEKVKPTMLSRDQYQDWSKKDRHFFAALAGDEDAKEDSASSGTSSGCHYTLTVLEDSEFVSEKQAEDTGSGLTSSSEWQALANPKKGKAKQQKDGDNGDSGIAAGNTAAWIEIKPTTEAVIHLPPGVWTSKGSTDGDTTDTKKAAASIARLAVETLESTWIDGSETTAASASSSSGSSSSASESRVIDDTRSTDLVVPRSGILKELDSELSRTWGQDGYYVLQFLLAGNSRETPGLPQYLPALAPTKKKDEKNQIKVKSMDKPKEEEEDVEIPTRARNAAWDFHADLHEPYLKDHLFSVLSVFLYGLIASNFCA